MSLFENRQKILKLTTSAKRHSVHSEHFKSIKKLEAQSLLFVI